MGKTDPFPPVALLVLVFARLIHGPIRMTPDEIISRIKYNFEQFGMGNPEPLYDFVAEDVVYNVSTPANASWAGMRRGRSAFRRIIGSLAEHIEFEVFELIDVFGSGERYAALIHERYVVKKTGRLVDQRILFIYRISGDQVVE